MPQKRRSRRECHKMACFWLNLIRQVLPEVIKFDMTGVIL